MSKIFRVYGNARPDEKRKGLGDMAEVVFRPIANALGLPCHDKATGDLKPESPCGRRRDEWNEFGKKIGIG